MEVGFESLLMSENARFYLADIGSWYMAELLLYLDESTALSDRAVGYRRLYSEFPRRSFKLYVMATKRTTSDSIGSIFEGHRALAFEADAFRLELREVVKKI